ncbi:hypothetical protein SLE2022_167440 [Rubroshorea leprosula]
MEPKFHSKTCPATIFTPPTTLSFFLTIIFFCIFGTFSLHNRTGRILGLDYWVVGCCFTGNHLLLGLGWPCFLDPFLEISWRIQI